MEKKDKNIHACIFNDILYISTYNDELDIFDIAYSIGRKIYKSNTLYSKCSKKFTQRYNIDSKRTSNGGWL